MAANMSSSNQSNVGSRTTYESSNQQNYSVPQVEEERRHHGVNTMGHRDQNKAVNELRAEDTQRQIDDRYKNEPGYAATLHGNEPSRGAVIDAEIAKEEAELLEQKKSKTDSVTGKKE